MAKARWLKTLAAGGMLLFSSLGLAGGIESLERFYDEVSSLEARFEQVQTNEDGEVTQQASGVFLLDRPNRFRWEYELPYEQIIASDGKAFRFYDVDLEQVTIRDADETLQATPAVLLAGGASLEDQFTLTSGKSEAGVDWVILKPLSEQSDFSQIRIGLTNERPVQMQLDDQLGQTTNIRFHDIKTNTQLEPARFALVIPDGVEIVDGRRIQN